jgi:nitroreductase
MPGYEQLMALLTKRRSTREFQDRDVEPEFISKIIEAAETAPSGVPPSQVHAIVFSGRDKVQQLRRDMTQALRAKKWLISPTVLALMKPFMGKSGARMMEEFVKPVFELYFRCDEEGTDWFLYDAPLGILFYGNEFSDPADGFIASTYAMLAAESLGLGNCMLGFPGLIFKYDKNLRKKYGLPNGMQPGVFVIFGHPDITYRNAIRRHIAGVEYA